MSKITEPSIPVNKSDQAACVQAKTESVQSIQPRSTQTIRDAFQRYRIDPADRILIARRRSLSAALDLTHWLDK